MRLIRRRSRVWVGNIRGKLLIQQNCGLFSPVKVISFDLLTFHQITFHQNIALTRSAQCSDWSEALSSAFWLAHSVPPAPLIVKLNRNKVSRETGRFILIGSSKYISVTFKTKETFGFIYLLYFLCSKKQTSREARRWQWLRNDSGRVSQRMIFLIHRCCFCQVSDDQVAESGSCVGHHLVVFLTRYQVTSSGLYFHLTRHGRLSKVWSYNHTIIYECGNRNTWVLHSVGIFVKFATFSVNDVIIVTDTILRWPRLHLTVADSASGSPVTQTVHFTSNNQDQNITSGPQTLTSGGLVCVVGTRGEDSCQKWSLN